MICSIALCGRPMSARGWCKRHYERWRVHGDPNYSARTFHGRGANFEPLADKLARKSAPSLGGCREWTGYRDPKFGYGQIAVGGRMEKAHRVAWAVSNGRPVPTGQKVRHTCDNPPCIEPGHLVLGTQRDNVADMFDRGRTNRRGERNNSARLTWEAVRELRSLRAAGTSVNELSSRFGVSKSQVRNVISNQHWKEPA